VLYELISNLVEKEPDSGAVYSVNNSNWLERKA